MAALERAASLKAHHDALRAELCAAAAAAAPADQHIQWDAAQAGTGLSGNAPKRERA